MPDNKVESLSDESRAQESSFFKEQQQQHRIYLVTDGLHSKHTITNYHYAFKQFLRDGAKTQDLQVMLDYPPRVIEQMIIGYVESLRDKGKARQTIKLHCAAIYHFFGMNDVTLNPRKIRWFVPRNESAHRDRAYDIEDIKRLYDSSGDERTKVIVSLLASTGMRIGAIPELRVGHLTPIPEFNLYQIEVYATSKHERYITYCTPACRVAIDAYLYGYRQRLGESITDESWLIREMFDSNNPFIINAPKRPTEKMVYDALERALKRSGVNQRIPSLGKGKRRNIMRSHGFRKFCITQMKKAGLDFSDRHSLLGHKSNPSNDLNYNRTEDRDLLLEYVKAIPSLDIDPTPRLEQENAELRKTQSDFLAEFGEFKEDFYEMKRLLVHLSKDSQKQLVDELVQKVGDKADIEWSCD